MAETKLADVMMFLSEKANRIESDIEKDPIVKTLLQSIKELALEGKYKTVWVPFNMTLEYVNRVMDYLREENFVCSLERVSVYISWDGR